MAIAGPSACKAEALAARLRDADHEACAWSLDGRSVSDIRKIVDQVATQMGGIHILVNCIGIQREQRLSEVTENTFDEMYQTNLRSAMFLAQSVARHQIEAGRGGQHIHLLSVRSSLALRGRGYSAYCATKGGLLMLVRQHALRTPIPPLLGGDRSDQSC